MAPASSIATQNSARNAITDTEIIEITNVEYTGEEARRWKHSIVAAARNIPTKIVGRAGAHEHMYIVETNTTFTTRYGTNPAPAVNPGGLTYTPGENTENQLVTMAQDCKDHEVALKAFHTQEGVTIGLGKVIFDSVPKAVILELEDNDTLFNEVASRDLITAVMDNATPDTILKSMELTTMRHSSSTPTRSCRSS